MLCNAQEQFFDRSQVAVSQAPPRPGAGPVVRRVATRRVREEPRLRVVEAVAGARRHSVRHDEWSKSRRTSGALSSLGSFRRAIKKTGNRRRQTTPSDFAKALIGGKLGNPYPYLRISHKICGGSALRPALLPSLSCRLVDQEILKLPSPFDRGNKPTRSCATTCPGFTRRTTILRWDFPPFQCTSAASDNSSGHSNDGHPLQLLFKFGPTLKKHFVNPPPQVHQRFNGHP